MDTVKIEVTTRVPRGKGGARTLRRAGLVPGVLYGGKKENLNVGVEPMDMVRLLRSSRGANSVLELSMDGQDQMAVVRDYQVHPVKRKLLHVDFLRVSPESVLVVSVPVKLVGKSLGEKAGGKLLHATRELKLRCAVSVIPEYIEVDVTEYEAGQMLYSKDMVFAEGIEPAFRGNFPIFSVAMPRGTQLLDEEEGEAAETEEE